MRKEGEIKKLNIRAAESVGEREGSRYCGCPDNVSGTTTGLQHTTVCLEICQQQQQVLSLNLLKAKLTHLLCLV